MSNVTLNISDTAYVSSLLPDTNISTLPLIFAGTDQTYLDCISYLQFTLPSLPVTSVDSALLELSVIAKTGISPSPVLVNRVTVPFSTDTVTYNTRPAFTATAIQYNVTTSDINSTIQIDVTTLVNDWLSGTFPNYGIALTNSDGTSVVEFATDGIQYEPFYPRLVITYTGSPVDNTAICFTYAQLAHIIDQLITLYPTSLMTVYTNSFGESIMTGTPYQLYSSAEGTYGSIFILLDNGQQKAIPLNVIAAIYSGDNTVYNPSITFLPTPIFPSGCDTNLITAYHDFLAASTEVEMYLGSHIQASGTLWKNEYGIIVLSNEDGSNPVFIPVINISTIFPLS